MSDLDTLVGQLLPAVTTQGSGIGKLYAAWRRDNTGEAAKWDAFLALLQAGGAPVPPVLASAFGRMLAAAGTMALPELSFDYALGDGSAAGTITLTLTTAPAAARAEILAGTTVIASKAGPASSFSIPVDTRKLANGVSQLTIRLTETDGSTTTKTVAVQVAN